MAIILSTNEKKIAGLIFLGASLFPPLHLNARAADVPCGYGFLLDHTLLHIGEMSGVSCNVDFEKLLLEYAILGAALFLWKLFTESS